MQSFRGFSKQHQSVNFDFSPERFDESVDDLGSVLGQSGKFAVKNQRDENKLLVGLQHDVRHGHRRSRDRDLEAINRAFEFLMIEGGGESERVRIVDMINDCPRKNDQMKDMGDCVADYVYKCSRKNFRLPAMTKIRL